MRDLALREPNYEPKTIDRKGGRKMKRLIRQSENKTGFTIVELLTVMSIIVILIGLLVPSLNAARRYASDVKQRAQFHSINAALELFKNEFEAYPDSNALDPSGLQYCGAMKLAEATVGQDLKGFNPNSTFKRADFGTAAASCPTPAPLYPPVDCPDHPTYADNIKSRKMYLPSENANAFQLASIYDSSTIGTTFDPNTFVLCDVYSRVTNKSTGRKIGMPILYYRANVGRTTHGYSLADNIYESGDNQKLVDLGMPWNPGSVHPMTTTPQKFYDETTNRNVPSGPWPYRADSYILISAGFDGQYGTPDDIFNF
jgi:type II secretory pathway pseudopilin PulG